MSTPRGAVLTLRWLGALTAAGAVALSSAGIATSLARSHDEVEFTSAPGLAVLRVELDSGRVEVTRGGSTVEVVRRSSGSWSLPESSADRNGDTLVLTGSCDSEFLGSGLCKTDFTVRVPADVALQLSAQAGEIVVVGGGAAVTATTSAGDIEVVDMDGGTVRASTSVGAVSLQFAAPPDVVETSSSTGDVEVVVPEDGNAYAVDTSNSLGSTVVEVPVDTDAPRRISAQTSVGSVAVYTNSDR